MHSLPPNCYPPPLNALEFNIASIPVSLQLLLFLLHCSSVRAQAYQWYGWSTSLELSRLLDPLCQALKGNATRTCMYSHITHSTNQEMNESAHLHSFLVYLVFVFLVTQISWPHVATLVWEASLTQNRHLPEAVRV